MKALIDRPFDKIELKHVRLALAKVKCPCKLDISVLYQLTRRLPHEGLDYDDERFLTLNRPGEGGGIRPQAGSSLCCAETVSSRELKLSDFYYILIGLNSEYKPVPWDIHCCHGNAIVEGCSVKFWLK